MPPGGTQNIEQDRRSQYLRHVQKKRMELLTAASLRFAKPQQNLEPSPFPIIPTTDKITTIPYEPSEDEPIPLYPEGSPEETGEEEETNEDVRKTQFASTVAQALLAGEKQAEQDKEKRKQTVLQQQVKKKAEAAIKRGAIQIVNLITSALNLGSGFVATLIDWVIYAATFGYLNLELFYGKYLMKGKDPFISEPSWDPLPLPLPNEWLDRLIIAADIFIFILIFTAIMAFIVIIVGIVAFLDNPLAIFTDFVGMGINIFQ
jgi:hypothetical protein